VAGRIQWTPRRFPGGGAGAGPQGQSAKPFGGLRTGEKRQFIGALRQKDA